MFEIRDTFRKTRTGFEERSSGKFAPSPMWTIAFTATSRVVEGAELTLPEGYTPDILERGTRIYGSANEYARVSEKQAWEYAGIGRQILELDQQGKIQPPLGPFEKESITHLVGMVDRYSK